MSTTINNTNDAVSFVHPILKKSKTGKIWALLLDEEKKPIQLNECLSPNTPDFSGVIFFRTVSEIKITNELKEEWNDMLTGAQEKKLLMLDYVLLTKNLYFSFRGNQTKKMATNPTSQKKEQ